MGSGDFRRRGSSGDAPSRYGWSARAGPGLPAVRRQAGHADPTRIARAMAKTAIPLDAAQLRDWATLISDNTRIQLKA